jgi:ankyrin repeat protein
MSSGPSILESVRDGDALAVRRLLSADASLVHATDECLKTPLHWAAEKNHYEIAEMLLDAGADLEATTSWGATPFDWAATMGSVRVADLLLARGAKGMNVVAAANLGKLDLVRTFLDSGARLTFPRQIAASELNDEVVASSARSKGDVISHAFYGACRNGCTEVAELLLERGADVNAKGILGGTGLHWAAINGHKETVAFLLAHGADLTIRDAKFHSTAEGWAAEGGKDEIRDLLRVSSARS